jgi:hypothetical protein
MHAAVACEDGRAENKGTGDRGGHSELLRGRY